MKGLLVRSSALVLVATSATAAFAQIPPTDPPPSDHAWNKTVDSAPSQYFYSTNLVAGPVAPNTTLSHAFPEKFKVWETVSDTAPSSPSWTTAYATLLDWTGSTNVSAKSDAFGNITFVANWDDTTEDGGGTPGVQHWVQEITSKNRERKQHWKVIVQL